MVAAVFKQIPSRHFTFWNRPQNRGHLGLSWIQEVSESSETYQGGARRDTEGKKETRAQHTLSGQNRVRP